MSAWHTLVDAPTLAAALGRPGLVVIDCRFSLADPQAGRVAYAAGHVPGAEYASLDDDLSGPPHAAAGRHPWPTADAMAATLRRWGIAPGMQVVAYDDGDGAFAARLWWLLGSLGHGEVAVLDGGFAAWVACALPVQVGARIADADADAALGHEAVASRASSDDAQAFDDRRLVDAAGVQAHLEHAGLLLDARAAPRFRGDVEPIDAVAGHVPGAKNRPYTDNLMDGRFKPAVQLAQEFRDLLGDAPATSMVVMCGSGVTACHHLLSMAHAGMPGGRLYAGSWSGWISDRARPVATGG